jgi:hypothetical protein
LWLEAVWTHNTGDRIDMHGFEQPHRDSDVTLIRNGLALLRELEYAGGRPPDIEKAAFRKLYWIAYQKVLDHKLREGGRRPNKTEVATELMIDRKTLFRYLKNYGLPWPPLHPD